MIYEDDGAFALCEHIAERAGHPRPGGVALGQHATARVDHGRWIVDCRCGGARLGKPGRFFWCTDCGNALAGGLQLEVVWPADVDAIEQALAGRLVENQHWFPHETIDDLLAENAAHGVGV